MGTGLVEDPALQGGIIKGMPGPGMKLESQVQAWNTGRPKTLKIPLPGIKYHPETCFQVGMERTQAALTPQAPWPGNVRQLQNVVQRTAALSTTPVITEALVREALTVEDQYLPSLSQARQQFEHDYLVKVLRLTNGSVAEAALLAQRNRTDFYKLLKRHNINPEQFKEQE